MLLYVLLPSLDGLNNSALSWQNIKMMLALWIQGWLEKGGMVQLHAFDLSKLYSFLS